MKQFARLYADLDESTSTNHKVERLAQYFSTCPAKDAAWAVYFLSGGKTGRLVPTAVLRQAALQVCAMPSWLFEECYQTVGDLAETISVLLPDHLNQELQKDAKVLGGSLELSLSDWVHEHLLPLKQLSVAEKTDRVLQAWAMLDREGRYLYIKLIGGGFRVGVSRLTVIKALAKCSGLDPKLIATRMMGYTESKALPSEERYLSLIETDSGGNGTTHADTWNQPLPFFLAHPFMDSVESLGHPGDWLIEWKYDGIRAQLVKGRGQICIWSRGEELITEQFPELAALVGLIPDGLILDGEILVWKDGQPSGFQALQARLNRKVISAKLLKDSPVIFMAYDVLKIDHQLTTSMPQFDRRVILEKLCRQVQEVAKGGSALRLLLSPRVVADNWGTLAALRQESRARGVEGFMLKHGESRYGVGRTKQDGVWWKWKIDPMSVDAVLVYAQRGHGRRANLYTDFTFAVWSRAPKDDAEVQAVQQAIEQGVSIEDSTRAGLPTLVPFAKAYSGLTDDEFKEVDAIIRKNTLTQFGPVRTVLPVLVFELGFEAIAYSNRHRSGVAVRFPRMLRIRQDKPIGQADTLATLKLLLPASNHDSAVLEDVNKRRTSAVVSGQMELDFK